jgi:hypothetical protein
VAQTLVYADTESHFVNNNSGWYYGTDPAIIVKTSSSADANACRGWLKFHTADADTGIPAGALIDSVYFDWKISYWYLAGTADGGMQLSRGSYFTTAPTALWTPTGTAEGQVMGSADTITLNTYYSKLLSGYNRSADTDLGVYMQLGEGAGGTWDPAWEVWFTEAPCRLQINWHLPPSGGTLPMLGCG